MEKAIVAERSEQENKNKNKKSRSETGEEDSPVLR